MNKTDYEKKLEEAKDDSEVRELCRQLIEDIDIRTKERNEMLIRVTDHLKENSEYLEKISLVMGRIRDARDKQLSDLRALIDRYRYNHEIGSRNPEWITLADDLAGIIGDSDE